MRPFQPPVQLPDSSGLVNITSWPGCATIGSDACSTPFHRLKMAVLAPMPSASDKSAVAVNPGLAAIVRTA